MNSMKNLNLKLHSLVIFRSLLSKPIIKSFMSLLEELGSNDIAAGVDAYCDFTSKLYDTGSNWSRCLLELALDDENTCVLLTAQGKSLSEFMSESLTRELAVLQEVSEVSCAQIQMIISTDIALPCWENEGIDIAAAYNDRLKQLHKKGYGIFAKHHVFSVNGNGELVPVSHPDTQRMNDLIGYENERRKVVVNTLALLDGMRANNILLYGDAGTGKSSTVKAIVNEYAEQGLRLIEIQKQRLHFLPDLMERLACNPLKFILFIDDLSFSSNDEGFTALKAILEGSVAARSQNVAIYATSNRRHLVKETFSDRAGDELHLADTLEEVSSLSARFGLTITFSKPDKDLYHSILEHLAQEYNLKTPLYKLVIQAEAFAIRNGGRSPRTARQFADLTRANELAAEKEENI
ncbi:MAG: ATP-binding protein [Oscillospiraceae bacterium]|nr:ATP-binding protein [Oscillospiraceae bacterium]